MLQRDDALKGVWEEGLDVAQNALEARRLKFLQSAVKVRIAASQSVVGGTDPTLRHA